MTSDALPIVFHRADQQMRVCLSGSWTLPVLAERGEVRRRQKSLQQATREAVWDLTAVDRLDSVGAQLLWQTWGQQLPSQIVLSDTAREMFALLAENTLKDLATPRRESWAWLRALGDGVFGLYQHLRDLVVWFGLVLIEAFAMLVRPQRAPWREISAQVFRVGTQALGITALVGFLIGVVLSYLSAQQLELFGASVYIVNLLGVAVVRELGPVLAAILVAGRSGSAITAQIGVMRVTQELDALSVMGISHAQRLVLPRVVALMVAMPLLVLWTDVMALAGGMVVAAVSLNLSPEWFVSALRSAISVTNLWIGLGKGVLFGLLIALVACHHGMRVEPNTESLGQGTTVSVVASITAVILADAVCAVLFSLLGW